jgi:hypothetical protein
VHTRIVGGKHFDRRWSDYSIRRRNARVGLRVDGEQSCVVVDDHFRRQRKRKWNRQFLRVREPRHDRASGDNDHCRIALRRDTSGQHTVQLFNLTV